MLMCGGNQWNQFVIKYFFILIALHEVLPFNLCKQVLNGWKPVHLTERVNSSEIVVSVSVERTFDKVQSSRVQHVKTYTAECNIKFIFKGKRRIDNLLHNGFIHRKLDQSLIANISNFGDPNLCFSNVDPSRSYILFLTVFRRRLSAKYFDLFGASAPRSIENEDTVFETVYKGKKWSLWSKCSSSCGGGFESRRFIQDVKKSQPLDFDNVQYKICNVHSCKGFFHLPLNKFEKRKKSNNRQVQYHQIFAPILPEDRNLSLFFTFQNTTTAWLIISKKINLPNVFVTMQLKNRITLNNQNSPVKVQNLFEDSSEQVNFVSSNTTLTTERINFIPTQIGKTQGSTRRNSYHFNQTFNFKISQRETTSHLKEFLSNFQKVTLHLSNDRLYVNKDCDKFSRNFKINKILLRNPLTNRIKFKIYLKFIIESNQGNPVALKDYVKRLLWSSIATRDDVCYSFPTNYLPVFKSKINCDKDKFYQYIRPGRVCTKPCLNGGTCNINEDGTEWCLCPPGYHGMLCQMVFCFPKCQNYGWCVGPNRCKCRRGYKGEFCQLPQCSVPCQNGGICIHRDFCFCPPGVYGKYCQHFSCQRECMNNGTCVGVNMCSCVRGFAGQYCNIDLSQNSELTLEYSIITDFLTYLFYLYKCKSSLNSTKTDQLINTR